MVFAFCFAEDTFFAKKYSITNFIIPIDARLVFTFGVAIGLALPIISYFVPVSEEGNVKQHVPAKDCRTWRGFEYRVVCGANGPCSICEEVCYVTRCHCICHV